MSDSRSITPQSGNSRESSPLPFESQDSGVFLDDSGISLGGPDKRRVTIAVEGNIGSGKSTFLQYFQNNSNVEVHAEPVSLWKDVKGYNALGLMYEDPTRWSLTFQSYVQLTMLDIHTRQQLAPVKLMERSIFSARYCFVENLFKSGCMPAVDYAVLEEWYGWILNNANVDVDLIVYLRASPETCLERIKKRNRKEESAVPIEYLQTLHDLHEDWLIRESKYKAMAPIVVIDADKDISQLMKEFEARKSELMLGYA